MLALPVLHAAYVDRPAAAASALTPDDDTPVIEALTQRFLSSDGIAVHLLEGAAMYYFNAIVMGDEDPVDPAVARPSAAATLLHDALMHAGNGTLISASVLRHDLPMAIAEEVGRVGLVVTPRQKGCAFPTDSNSGFPAMKRWMQTCLHRCVPNPSGAGGSWLLAPSGVSKDCADPALWAAEAPVVGSTPPPRREYCAKLGTTQGADCTLNRTLSATYGYARCTCYETWDEAFEVQKLLKPQCNEVFIGQYHVDAVFYTTSPHIPLGDAVWANFTGDDAVSRNRVSRRGQSYARVEFRVSRVA